MNNKPIFIHSLFRTGSTYFWNKFRQKDQYYCYYEPFHQDFVSLSREHPDLWEFSKVVTQQMNFPDLDRSLTFEYRNLIMPEKKGLPLFRKSFSFDEYCHNGSNLRAKKYLDSLTKNAKSKIPVLQFNRSPLRIKWFKSNYPDALHLYLVRHPHDQFQSYVSMMKDNELDIFLVMDLMIAGKNQNSEMFRLLASRIPLVDVRNRNFKYEGLVYGILSNCYSAWEKYYIFYFIWFYSFYENVSNADFIVNMDLLTSDLEYRRKVVRFLKKAGITNIDFRNANLRKYQTFLLKKTTMREIEREIQSLFFQYTNKRDQDDFFSKASRTERDFFGILKTIYKKDKGEIAKNLPYQESYEFDDSVKTVIDALIRKYKRAENLELDLKRLNSTLVPEQQEMNKAIEMIDVLKDHQISKLREIHLMREKQELEKVNKKLAIQSELLDKKSKEFKLDRPVEKKNERQIVEKEKLLKEFEHELNRTALWFEEEARELQKKKLLLIEKSMLIKQIKRKIGR